MGGSVLIDNIEYIEFDNFFNISFIFNGKIWSSSEQAYQALKFDDEEHIEKIRNESDMSMILYLGHVKFIKYIDGWRNLKYVPKNMKNPFEEHSNVNLMYRVNLEKIKQNDRLKKRLLQTKGKIKGTGSSSFWNKWNGLILEKIRKELSNIC